MEKIAQEKFSISYDADEGDYEKHEIDAMILGKSIVGVCDLVAKANTLIFDGSVLDLKVSSPAREGSVVIDFLLLATSPESLQVLKYLGLSATGGALVGGSLVEVVKKINNKKVTKLTIDDSSNTATIETDGKTITCDKYLAQLAVDKKVRVALHDVVQAPIAGQKNAKFKVLNAEDSEVVVVEESAAHKFSPLPEGSLESEEVVKEKTTGYFVQVNFQSEHGWRLKRGDGDEHPVVLLDKAFMTKVNQNQQSFSKEELFEVEIEKKSIQRQTRTSHQYVVTKVTKHFVDKPRRLV